MPTWQSFDAFGKDIVEMSADIERESRKVTARKMAERGQQIAESAASRDLGGDPKFSGWAPKLDTEVKTVRDGALLKPTRSSAGPWTVAEQGRNKGGTTAFLGPGANRRTGETGRRKDGSVRKVRRFKAKRWNGRTKGKNTASEAVKRMERALPPIAEKETRKVMLRRFDVD